MIFYLFIMTDILYKNKILRMITFYLASISFIGKILFWLRASSYFFFFVIHPHQWP